MGDEEFKVGDIVEVTDAINDSLTQHPLAPYVGKRGVVHWVPDLEDPDHAGHEGIIVLFDDPAFPGLSSHKSHFRKVE
jgi:hypothetical protein